MNAKPNTHIGGQPVLDVLIGHAKLDIIASAVRLGVTKETLTGESPFVTQDQATEEKIAKFQTIYNNNRRVLENVLSKNNILVNAMLFSEKDKEPKKTTMDFKTYLELREKHSNVYRIIWWPVEFSTYEAFHSHVLERIQESAIEGSKRRVA